MPGGARADGVRLLLRPRAAANRSREARGGNRRGVALKHGRGRGGRRRRITPAVADHAQTPRRRVLLADALPDVEPHRNLRLRARHHRRPAAAAVPQFRVASRRHHRITVGRGSSHPRRRRGPGHQVAQLLLTTTRATVVALDLSAHTLAYSEQQLQRCAPAEAHRVQHVVGDIEQLSVTRPFHQVACIGVLHHCPNPAKALGRLARALEVGGVMQLATYSRLSVPTSASRARGSSSALSAAVEGEAADAGRAAPHQGRPLRRGALEILRRPTPAEVRRLRRCVFDLADADRTERVSAFRPDGVVVGKSAPRDDELDDTPASTARAAPQVRRVLLETAACSTCSSIRSSAASRCSTCRRWRRRRGSRSSASSSPASTSTARRARLPRQMARRRGAGRPRALARARGGGQPALRADALPVAAADRCFRSSTQGGGAGGFTRWRTRATAWAAEALTAASRNSRESPHITIFYS